MSKRVPWQDDEGRWHNYPREWHNHWFDNGYPSREARIAAIRAYLEMEGAEKPGLGDGARESCAAGTEGTPEDRPSKEAKPKT